MRTASSACSTEGRAELAAERPAQALEALEQALALWRGPVLADLSYEAFAQAEIARLEDLRVAAVEQLIEAKLALGRHAEVVGQLETLIVEHPYRERLRAQLMLALYRCDRQADALQAYQDARRKLVEELGIEPGERLRELESAILAQDAALAVPTAPAAPAVEDAAPPETDPATVELPTGVVTFVLTDIEGSTALWEADPEGMAVALELHDELIARIGANQGADGFSRPRGRATPLSRCSRAPRMPWRAPLSCATFWPARPGPEGSSCACGSRSTRARRTSATATTSAPR